MSHRASAEQLDRYRRRSAAAEFLRVHRVPEQLETVLDQVFLQRPADLHGFLAEHFLKLAAPPTISSLRGTQVYDATGQLSVQAEVFCVVCNKEKRMSWAAVAYQETSLDRTRADHVTTAVQWINGPLNDLLLGQNPCNQSEVDQKLRDFFTTRSVEEKNLRDMKNVENLSLKEPNMELPSPPSTQRKSKKSADGGKQTNPSEKPVPPAEPAEEVLCGSAAIGSVSVAVLKSGAAVKNIPLYRHTAALKNAVLRQTTPGLQPPAHNQNQNQVQVQVQVQVPVCLVTLLRGGRTSPGRRSLLKEVLLIPAAGRRVRQANHTTVCDAGVPAVSVDRPEQLLDLVAEACSNLGLVLGRQIHLALDCAAPELLDYAKGKYEVSTGVLKSPDELVDMYHTLLSRYPAVVFLIDPFRTEDWDQWDKLNKKLGHRCSLISDLTYQFQAPPPQGARGVVLKHSNQTTVSDLIHMASQQRGSVLMGTTCSEPCTDDSWSDIAVGLGLDYVKLGGLSGAERISKYNRLISIEEELAAQGILVTRERLPPPLFPEDPHEQLVPVEPNICDGEQNPVCST